MAVVLLNKSPLNGFKEYIGFQIMLVVLCVVFFLVSTAYMEQKMSWRDVGLGFSFRSGYDFSLKRGEGFSCERSTWSEVWYAILPSQVIYLFLTSLNSVACGGRRSPREWLWEPLLLQCCCGAVSPGQLWMGTPLLRWLLLSGGRRCALEKSKGFPQALNTAACSGSKLPAGLLCSVYSQFCLCMPMPVFLSAYSE